CHDDDQHDKKCGVVLLLNFRRQRIIKRYLWPWWRPLMKRGWRLIRVLLHAPNSIRPRMKKPQRHGLGGFGPEAEELGIDSCVAKSSLFNCAPGQEIVSPYDGNASSILSTILAYPLSASSSERTSSSATARSICSLSQR